MALLHEELTGQIIKCFYKVYNTLGYGFLEKVYENALLIELGRLGLRSVAQMPVQVFYEGQRVGYYVADLCVEGVVIVEIKAAEELTSAHQAQMLNYLKATGLEVGLLLNFGPKPQFLRRIYTR